MINRIFDMFWESEFVFSIEQEMNHFTDLVKKAQSRQKFSHPFPLPNAMLQYCCCKGAEVLSRRKNRRRFSKSLLISHLLPE